MIQGQFVILVMDKFLGSDINADIYQPVGYNKPIVFLTSSYNIIFAETNDKL